MPAAHVDALFKHPDRVCRDGDLSLAREAYRRLLDAVATRQEESIDEYETEDPELETDLGEVKARYFRALYETAPSRNGLLLC